ncbi:hypothetical protein MTO96_023778 [Rhipicephalus appendiculatus]
MASSVPVSTTTQAAAAEDVVPSTTDPSKPRKHKKRKGHRVGSTKEPKSNKPSIMTPMNGNDEEIVSGIPTPSVATTPKSTQVLSPPSLVATPTPRDGDSRNDSDTRSPVSDKSAEPAASTEGSSIASPVSPAPRRSETHSTKRQQAGQEREQCRDREKDRSKGKPRNELVQPQDHPIATTAVPKCSPPRAEEQKTTPSLIQAKTQENDDPQQAPVKDMTSSSEG